MKATINLTGKLTIVPEAPVEAYALSQWWQNFQHGDQSSSLSVSVAAEPPVHAGEDAGNDD